MNKIPDLPTRKWTIIRRFYHNQEFLPGGYATAARRESLNPKLPDPLENLYLVVYKSFKMPYRQSPDTGVVADDRCRGMSGLALKTLKDQELNMVTKDVYQQMVGREGSGEIDADDVSTLMHDEDEVVEEASKEDTNEKKSVFVSPWECSENDYANVIKLYEGKDSARIVFIHGGCAGVLAAVRAQKECLALVQTEVHQQVLWEAVIFKVLSELTLGESEGFAESFALQKKRRPLTRENSLSGAASIPPPAAAATAEDSEVKPNEESESSSSESGGDD